MVFSPFRIYVDKKMPTKRKHLGPMREVFSPVGW